jgi:hypothetical protein
MNIVGSLVLWYRKNSSRRRNALQFGGVNRLAVEIIKSISGNIRIASQIQVRRCNFEAAGASQVTEFNNSNIYGSTRISGGSYRNEVRIVQSKALTSWNSTYLINNAALAILFIRHGKITLTFNKTK